MNTKGAVPAIVLIALFAVSIFFELDPITTPHSPDFYVGVEFAYSNNLSDSQVNVNCLKALVDKVENYTNLFIIGIPEISLNQTALTESCDYISNAGLHFIILFTDTTQYRYDVTNWTTNAHENYGNLFLGVYRIDEPGGKELDNATFNNAPNRFLNQKNYNPNVKNYTGASQEYINFLGLHLDILSTILSSKIFTSDYGLYWFDYKAGYEAVFGEFVGNQSKQIAVSLCRGAAQAQNKDWGVTVTWTYNQEPYIESGQKLYSDLTLAYQSGAKYAVIFDYPNSTQYGILTEEHFDALKNFWTYINNNPGDHGVQQGKVAYVLPQDYGFGFRSPNDSIWGIWNADEISLKVWNDTNKLISQYGSNLDIVYSDPQFTGALTNHYDKLFFWNETIP